MDRLFSRAWGAGNAEGVDELGEDGMVGLLMHVEHRHETHRAGVKAFQAPWHDTDVEATERERGDEGGEQKPEDRGVKSHDHLEALGAGLGLGMGLRGKVPMIT